MNVSRQKYRVSIVGCIISAALYLYIGYGLERTETVALLSSWAILFAIYFYIANNVKDNSAVKFFLGGAIAFRLLFLFSIPALSDDYFRFIWDGELSANHLNPFLYTPSEVLRDSSIIIPRLDGEMYTGLNSPNYYSVYPPVMQFVFWLCAKLSTSTLQAIVIMRIVIILCELGTLYLLIKLLDKFKQPLYSVLLYAFNPLVIVELTGNLHFEAVMIFFLILALYCLTSNKILISATALGLSICSKLVPLVLLPVLLRHLGVKKFVVYSLIVGVVSITLFIPFVSNDLVANISESIGLYFQTFEFNASLYYLIREVGYWVKGYNIISASGKALPIVFIIFYGVYLMRQKSSELHEVFNYSVWVLAVYYVLALIVHPWYLSLLVVLATFTNLKFPIVWSAMIGITYITYQTTPYKENLYGVAIEYIVVLIAVIYDLKRRSHIVVI